MTWLMYGRLTEAGRSLSANVPLSLCLGNYTATTVPTFLAHLFHGCYFRQWVTLLSLCSY